MKKRAAVLLLMIILMFSAVGVRLYDLSTDVMQASGAASSKTLDVATLRGTVYDCKMRPLTNSEYDIYAAAKPSVETLAALKGKVMPDVFETVMRKMSKGNPVAVKVETDVAESENLISVRIPRRYSAAFTACHIIGSLDSAGQGISGIEKAYNDLLSRNNSTVSFHFYANALGRVMLGEGISVSGNEVPKNGVVLTIDRDIQQITEAVLDAADIECGAAVVIDTESGAIRACVSRPLYNQNNIAVSLDDPRSPLINRAFLPFSVGSVFKPVVAAAALESGISKEFTHNCKGSAEYNGVTFHCHKKEGHGVLNMEEAVAYSCNTYFIALAIETGAEKIIGTAEKFGFGKKISFSDGVDSAGGNLPSADELDSKAAIANISFGQGSLLATPVQICSIMATIAGDGEYVEPYLIEGETDKNGKMTRIYRYGKKRRIINSPTAEKLQGFLEKVVEYGSGSRAKSKAVTVAGKTATAQTGKTADGEEIYNAWFAGYFPADNPKYAVAILKEDGGEGALSCAPVFKTIAEKITALSELCE
ncbi:MAG: penicillin-binding protein 2 [Clostridia bacterium]|nr:penicillin-binding protein 2 [Clostridia bacterium]